MGRKNQGFTFDQVFDENFSNVDVFTRSISPLIPNLFEGFNVTCMAYGITGAGKTYTMLGHKSDLQSKSFSGIGIMAIDAIFGIMNSIKDSDYQTTVRVSYLEVYNENIKDLLSTHKESNNLVIIEDPQKGIHVPGLKEVSVNSASDALKIILQGNERRTMSPTSSNEFSSWSHAIILINLERKPKDSNKPIISSKLSIVDLAGSEKESYEIREQK